MVKLEFIVINNSGINYILVQCTSGLKIAIVVVDNQLNTIIILRTDIHDFGIIILLKYNGNG